MTDSIEPDPAVTSPVAGQTAQVPANDLGEVMEILERGITHTVGTLQCSEGTWFIIPDGVSSPSAV